MNRSAATSSAACATEETAASAGPRSGRPPACIYIYIYIYICIDVSNTIAIIHIIISTSIDYHWCLLVVSSYERQEIGATQRNGTLNSIPRLGC